MALSAEDKANVRSFWENIRGDIDEIGREALERTFLTFPSTKIYFPDFDLSPGSDQVRDQGSKVIIALSDAVDNMDDLEDALDALAELHAFRLRVDPINFRFLTHGMLVSMSSRYPEDFTPAVHSSMDKFLTSVSEVLTSKYR